jgi:glucosamine--fructose-6-phosphate aminotransferase (isomerizing)
MLKEIHEQPTALVDTLNQIINRDSTQAFTLKAAEAEKILRKAEEIVIVACGTSWHAAMVGKYWLESLATIPVSVELASEFRYRDAVLRRGVVVIGISQSGETADTLAVIRDVKQRGVKTLAITNVKNCTLSREADATFYTAAGPEVGVAATKTYMTQMLMLLLCSGSLATRRKEIFSLERDRLKAIYEDLQALPHVLKDYLSADRGKDSLTSTIKSIARSVADARGFFFMGRGLSYPIALEGALKLKEIAYIHSEGYAAGELKHGPIAMIDEGMVAVVLAPTDKWRDKTVSNLEEVKARGARIIGVGNPEDTSLKVLCDYWIELPALNAGVRVDECLLPFFLTPVVQLLSYELALLRGTDVDKPRNLAKSVTVE